MRAISPKAGSGERGLGALQRNGDYTFMWMASGWATTRELSAGHLEQYRPLQGSSREKFSTKFGGPEVSA